MLVRITSPVTLSASGTPKSIAVQAIKAVENANQGESAKKPVNVLIPSPIAA